MSLRINNILVSVYLALKKEFNLNLRHLKRACEIATFLTSKIEEKQALIEAIKYGFIENTEEERIIKIVLDNSLLRNTFSDIEKKDFTDSPNVKNFIPENIQELIQIIAQAANENDIKEVLFLLARLIAHKNMAVTIYALKTAFEIFELKEIRELIIEQLKQSLEKDWSIRNIGAQVLAEIYAQYITAGDKSYLSHLQKLLQENDQHIKAAVIPIITSLYTEFVLRGEEQYFYYLEKFTKDKNLEIAQAAYKALEKIYLEKIRKGYNPDLNAIENILEEGELSKRIIVMNTLGSIYAALIKQGMNPNLQKLEKFLDSRYGGLKDATVRALGKIYSALIQIGKEPNLSYLESMLFADDWRIRVTAANTLGELYGQLVEKGKNPSFHKLEALFQDRHGSVRKTAAEALGNVYLKLAEKGDKSGLKRLEEIIHKKNWLLTRVVSISLAYIYSSLIQKDNIKYLPKLEAMLEEDDFYVNIVTISSLATVYIKLIEKGISPQLGKLENMLEHEDLYIRIAAASALTNIYSALVLTGNTKYLEMLEEMLLDGEWYVKKATASALVNTYAYLISSGEKRYLKDLERMTMIEDTDIPLAAVKTLSEIIKNTIQSKKNTFNIILNQINLLLRQTLSSPLKGSFASEIKIEKNKVKIGYLNLKRKNDLLPPHCVFTQSAFSLLKAITFSYLLNHPVLLLGPTSTGKSFLVKWLANLLGYEHISYTINPYSSKFELIGGIKPDKEGKFIWQDGIILKAAKEGKWLVLEEINLASSDVIEILNDYLTTGKFLYSENGEQKKLTPHPDFRLFATANPESYSQRQRLSEVFLSRWKIYYQKKLAESEIAEILSSLFKIPASLALLIAKFHKTMEKQSQARLIGKEERDPYIYSLRDVLRLGKRLKNKSSLEDLFFELYTVYLSRIRNKAEKEALLLSLDAHFGFRAKGLNLEEIIRKKDLDISKIPATKGLNFIPEKEAEIIPTSSQKMLLCQIISAIIQAEPVLLVGMPAAGKTTLIRYLAKEIQTDLYYVNLSSDTGLEELLGGYIQNKTGKWYYREGLLFKAVDKGAWLLIDEANLNPLSEYLNTLIDFGYIIDEEGKTHYAHPNFRLFLAMNPPRIHISRNLLSPSLRSRFLEIWIEEVLEEKELRELVDYWSAKST